MLLLVYWVCLCLTLWVFPVYTPGESMCAPVCSALGVCLCLLCSVAICGCGLPGQLVHVSVSGPHMNGLCLHVFVCVESGEYTCVNV